QLLDEDVHARTPLFGGFPAIRQRYQRLAGWPPPKQRRSARLCCSPVGNGRAATERATRKPWRGRQHAYDRLAADLSFRYYLPQRWQRTASAWTQDAHRAAHSRLRLRADLRRHGDVEGRGAAA